ncbi:PIG-L family deacetylase [Lentzea californiensis]|uniref:PIG-L family deacetylase n=1 Tax=Lentzea californiensis TaxID=438851 RepID=UPI002166A4C6|nr:PIG-L family deacetylase [Lentzea californiensis]MCR3750196.1 GlcNAc-PI de-N-acetylase [Lentzea californiensis]
MRRSVLSLFTSMILVAATLTHAQAAPTTTISFVAHPDDDLLFMNPDIASDVEAGSTVWVVYLTAGEVHTRPPFPYANQRVEGERAAYARTAGVADSWTYEEMWFNGHPVATNRLNGTNVRLVFTYIHGASGGCDHPNGDPQGDLYKMLAFSPYVAQPIDGRPSYNRFSFVGMLRAIIAQANPDHIRSGSTIGHRDSPRRDHVDHVSAALLVAEANLADGTRDTWKRRDEYTAYNSESYPENVSGYWRQRKEEIWDAYWPHDPEIPHRDIHPYAFGRQIRPEGRIFWPGSAWVPPGDFVENGC